MLNDTNYRNSGIEKAYKYINKRVIVNIACIIKNLELHVIYTNKNESYYTIINSGL